jgi:hypothetical protein
MHMDDIREFVTTKVSDIVEAKDLLNRLLAIAQPEAVFGEPIEVGEQKIITASEVTAGLGFGFGAGGGAAEPGEAKGRVLVAQNGPSVVPEADEEAEKTSGDVEASGMGGSGDQHHPQRCARGAGDRSDQDLAGDALDAGRNSPYAGQTAPYGS